jgi:hypothetical protein
MMWFSGTRNRRPRRPCQSCGGAAPLDAIRLRGGRLYCPQGDCRRAAERLILEARGRLETTPAAREAWSPAEMRGVASHRDDDRGAAATGVAVVLESIELEIAAGAILV